MNKIHPNVVTRLDRLDLNLLKIFNLLYKHQSIKPITEILCLSQSAVSHAINRLRKQLNDPLFERQGKLLIPTAYAKSIAPHIEYHLNTLQSILFKDRVFDPTTDIKSVKIALPDELELFVLPILIETAIKKGNHAQWISTRSDPQTTCEDLAKHKTDIWIDTHHPVDESIVRRQIGQSPYCVISRSDRQSLNLEDYLSAKHVAVSGITGRLTFEDQALQNIGLNRHIQIYLQRYRAAVRLATTTDMLLTIPIAAVKALGLRNRLHIHPLPFEMDPFRIFIYWHLSNQTNPVTQWLIAQIVKASNELSLDGHDSPLIA